MKEQFLRTKMLIGEEGLEKLNRARVAVFGVGGVGGYTVEALVRSGIGAIDLIDNDKYSITNLNRQLYATKKTIGQYKVDAAKERIIEINSEVKVKTYKIFYTEQTAREFDFSKYDYIIDAIDTVVGKIELIVNAKKAKVPIISSMGAGNKMNAAMLEVSDISKTTVCPLARVMRKELKKRKIEQVKVVYSKEIPIKPKRETNGDKKIEEGEKEKRKPGSNAFVPAVAGLIIAGEVVKDIIKAC